MSAAAASSATAVNLVLGPLLFAPIEPLVIATPDWRPGGTGVPRSALGPLAGAVREGMGPAAAALETALAGRSGSDRAAIGRLAGRLGAVVWPAAARILARAAVTQDRPPGWAEAGLSPAAHGPLASRVAALLRHAPRLRAIADPSHEDGTSESADPRAVARAVLDDAAADGAEAWTMTLVLLLSHADQPGEVLREALGAGVRRPDRALAERAIEAVLERFEAAGAAPLATGLAAAAGASETAEFARALRRSADLLDGVQDAGAAGERRRRLDRIRHALARACHERLEQGLARDLLGRPDAAPEALEAVARDMGRLAHAGRRLAAARAFDAPLLRAAAAVGASDARGGGDLVDRVRLIEILAGPEAAMAVLEKKDKGVMG